MDAVIISGMSVFAYIKMESKSVWMDVTGKVNTAPSLHSIQQGAESRAWMLLSVWTDH